MSGTSTITLLSLPLIARRTRAYFAPVNRATCTPTLFDPALSNDWNFVAPSLPWVDLGWISAFTRVADSKYAEVDAGMPATIRNQVRETLGAVVSFKFSVWSKLTMALGSGSQHMNVLAAASPASAPVGSGGSPAPAWALGQGSSATTIYLAPPAQAIAPGGMVVVDFDYAGQIGFLGSGVSGGYVTTPTSVGTDPNYIRRVSFNVGRVVAIGNDGGVQLATPLIAGVPASGMKVQLLNGFVDREGGGFFQEWSALFAIEGVQGDRLFLHYPRLQSCQSAAETSTPLAPGLYSVQPEGKFRALPVIDENDGERVLCYRTYVPANTTYI